MGRFSLLALAAFVASAVAAPAPIPEAFADEIGNLTMPELVKRAGRSLNYNQNYVAGGASVSYSPNLNAGTFSINFNTRADFVVGIGWQPGDSSPITYSGSYSASGVGLLTVYGWTTNPLVEYYIMEDPIGYPTAGQQKGTISSDGGSYAVWLHQQVNQPSIQGTSTFNQYISIRQGGRTSGTVTLQNHFNAWAGYGMQLGTQNFQVFGVESWSGSGQGSMTVSKGTNSGSTSPSSTGGSTPTQTTSKPATSSTGSPSGGSAQWGQCGGIGWTGPNSCQSPWTCHYSNSYYSQCY